LDWRFLIYQLVVLLDTVQGSKVSVMPLIRFAFFGCAFNTNHEQSQSNFPLFSLAAWNDSEKKGVWASMPMSQLLIGKALG
jgi:hypothetical protein